MKKVKEQPKKLKKHDWIVPTLLLGLVGLITAAVVLVVYFYSDLQEIYQEQIEVYLFNFVLVGFVLLGFLFVGYLFLKEFASKKLKANLLRQVTASRTLERRVTELETVHQLSSLVNSEMALSDLLEAICSKAMEALTADQGSLFLYDPEQDELLCVSAKGPESDRIRDASVGVGKSVAGWVVRNGKPLNLDSDLDVTRFDDFIKKDKRASSSLCLPVMVKNQARGVLNITLFDPQRKFDDSDMKLALIFAENAAIAIDKAGLYEELEKHTRAMKKAVKELRSSTDRSAKDETLRALSNLACGMSQEFVNTLSSILSKVGLLLKDLETAPLPDDTKNKAIDLLRATEKLAAAGSETARHVGVFAKTFQPSSERELEELDINKVVEQALTATSGKWNDEAELKGKKIEVETELGQNLSLLVGNQEDIKNVLTSLIFNAIDALPQGGKIKIATRMIGNSVAVDIKDNGVGMSEEMKSKIFEPFFTTKEDGGHGIGLSVAQGIISRHQGHIRVESHVGVGTTFTIILPVSPPGISAGRNPEKDVLVYSTQ